MMYNIIVAGIGGQGVITTSKIIAEAALYNGNNVLVAETHGLSQRGGSVIVHVRIGDVDAPLIPPGMTDLLIGLEAIEAARYAHYLKPGSPLALNLYLQPPSLPRIKIPSIDAIIGGLRRAGLNVYVVNATGEAVKLGDPRSMNTLLLGYAHGLGLLDPIAGVREFEVAIEKTIRKSSIAVNAFRLGVKLAASMTLQE